MKNSLLLVLYAGFLTGCLERKIHFTDDFVIANGQMPDIVKDNNNKIHLVYGTGDSIMYSNLSENATSFSQPLLIGVLPHAYSFATRGPQIAATKKGIIITACNSIGDIYSFYKTGNGKWLQGHKVNDVDTINKEGLMDLSADDTNVFAVWLDLRGNGQNKLYGAKSNDGGKTWEKNTLVYASPNTSVCECCKPTVAVRGNNVYVMFRNWLNGNRDLYIAQSIDSGNTFGQAKKLGNGNWKLNGCPMDGGGMAINGDGELQTVWRRGVKVYAARPGMPEKEIGEGRGCSVETVNNKNIYTWTENGQVVIINTKGEKKILGEGMQPVLKALNNDYVICVWEDEKQIHASILAL
ncbi:MAG: sialidase family protein [Ferruginibacter sp.]